MSGRGFRQEMIHDHGYASAFWPMAKYCTTTLMMMMMMMMMMGLMQDLSRLDGEWHAGRRNEGAATEQLS